MASGLVDLTVRVHGRTAKAVRVSTDGEDRSSVWLPLSQVELAEPERIGGPAQLTLPEWLAIDKGLV